MQKAIKIAIVGIGNCASSLVQGLEHYSKNSINFGLKNKFIGKYAVKDIEIVAAIDIDSRKVGKKLSKAIFSLPNNTTRFCKTKSKKFNLIVQRGPTLDGIPKHMLNYSKDVRFCESKQKPIDIIAYLKKTKPDFFLCYLPVGSIEAVKYYANCALSANISFINCMPVFIGSDKSWIKKFKNKKLLVFGDDVKSQIGATILHRVITNLFRERGCILDDTYQINIGGNTDFLNMMDKERLKLKWESKISSVISQYGKLDNIYAGPAEYISYLKDNKVAHINWRGRGFGNLPINIDLKLSVEDSPNSAGVIIDVIRLAKVAKDRKIVGTVPIVNAFAFKHPMIQYTDGVIFEELKSWLNE